MRYLIPLGSVSVESIDCTRDTLGDTGSGAAPRRVRHIFDPTALHPQARYVLSSSLPHHVIKQASEHARLN